MELVTRVYDVDLSTPTGDAWADVVDGEEENAKAVYEEAYERIVDGVGPSISSIMAKTIRALTAKSRIKQEIKMWARHLGIPYEQALIANASYSLTAFGEWASMQTDTTSFLKGLVGCTAGAVRHPEHGMLHYRNMDWDVPAIHDATCIMNLRSPHGHVVHSVGVAGYSGVLSAMVTGEYSVSLNFAPPTGCRPSLDLSLEAPMFLREAVLEHNNYGDLVDHLQHTEIGTGAIFVVCGVESSVKIERGVGYVCAGPVASGDKVVAANHFEGTDLSGCLPEDGLHIDSEGRSMLLDYHMDCAARVEKFDHKFGGEQVLGTDPVMNDATTQSMVFRPSTGEMAAWS